MFFRETAGKFIIFPSSEAGVASEAKHRIVDGARKFATYVLEFA